jgi:hypothetical protein
MTPLSDPTTSTNHRGSSLRGDSYQTIRTYIEPDAFCAVLLQVTRASRSRARPATPTRPVDVPEPKLPKRLTAGAARESRTEILL